MPRLTSGSHVFHTIAQTTPVTMPEIAPAGVARFQTASEQGSVARRVPHRRCLSPGYQPGPGSDIEERSPTDLQVSTLRGEAPCSTKTPTTAHLLEMFSDVCWFEFERGGETVTFPEDPETHRARGRAGPVRGARATGGNCRLGGGDRVGGIVRTSAHRPYGKRGRARERTRSPVQPCS